MDVIDRMLENKIQDANVSVAISDIITQKNELASEVKDAARLPQITIQDREYLQSRTKNLIDRCQDILDKLDSKIDEEDVPVTRFLLICDTYSRIVNAASTHIRELRELNKMIMGIEAINAEQFIKQAEEQKSGQTIKMSSSDLLKLIDNARCNSTMNAINAEFKVIS